MKEPWEWEFEDIENLVKNQVPESLNLDYKSSLALSKKKISEISKDVSSFANSAGGVIIYGIVEKEQIPVRVDEGVNTDEISQEWLEQIINSNIQRRINGVRINKIKLPASSSNVVYVISIPQSYEAPHMADDNKYYKRFNFASVPMQDYEVRDSSHRSTTPLLEIQFQYSVNSIHNSNLGQNLLNRIGIDAIVFNLSDAPANYAVLSLFLDCRLEFISSGNFKKQPGRHTFHFEDKYLYMDRFSMNHALPNSMPIWKGVNFRINENPLVIEFPKPSENITYYFGWSASAPGMDLRYGLAGFTPKTDGGSSLDSIEDVKEYYPYLLGDKKYLNEQRGK